MEHYKRFKLLNDSTVSKFVTKKWVEVNHLPSDLYSNNKNTRFKASLLGSDLCDYSGAYTDVKKIINVKATADTDVERKGRSVWKYCTI